MTKNKETLLIAGLACLLVILGVVLAICFGGFGNVHTDPSVPQGTVGTEEITYTVEVTNQGGLYLKDVGIFIYADSTLQDLVWFDRTNEDGKISFVALESDNYVAVLNEIPTGYAAEDYYPLTGAQTKIVLGAATMGEDDELPSYKLGDMVMDFAITGLDGTEYTLSELLEDKKAVVLNFWYLECQPCKAEFPFLQEAYAKHSEDIAVLGMNPINTDTDAIAAFQKEMGITFPLVACGSEWEQIMQLTAYPTTVVIDRFGNICLIHRGSIDKTAIFESMFTYFAAEDYEQKLLGSVDELPMEEEDKGSEENPEEVAGQTTFEVTVEPGQEHFVEVFRVTGMYMSVTGEGEFYMLNDGKRYESKNGKIELVVTTGDNYTPSNFGFGNPGKDPVKLKVSFSFLKGTYGNPYTLELGDFAAKVAAGNDQGTYYIYTAKEEGALMVQYLSGTSGVEYGLTLYNLTSGAYRTIDEDGSKDEEGIPTVAVKVNKGDQVQLIVAALPDKDFNYPGGTFNLRAKMGDASEADKNQVPKQDYTVTVKDTDGNPVSGVTLTMTVEEKETTIKTDSNGEAIINLNVGTYKITLVVPAGYTCDVTEYELTAEKPDCIITLVPKTVVKHDYIVTVLNDSGAPLANVTVIQGEIFATTDASGKAVLKDLVEFAYTVDIAKPDGYVVAPGGYTFAEGKWEMTVKLQKEILPGQAEAPIEISEYPFIIENIGPGQERYYKLYNAGGMALNFYGVEGAYVSVGGVKYESDFGGTVIAPLGEGDGQIVVFGNTGAEPKKYNVSLQHPAGSEENPEPLSELTQFDVALKAGDADGMFYTWTANDNYEVTLSADSGYLKLTVGEKAYEGNLKDGISFSVNKGEKITLQVLAAKDSSPAADIAVNGILVVANSASNPEVLTNISQIHLQLPVGKPQGYYYLWTADGEGRVVFRIASITLNVNAQIILKCGDKSVAMLEDEVTMYVAEGDEVLIQVRTLAASNELPAPAADIVFGGGFELGSKANPEVLSDLTAIHTVMAAGDPDGYYYNWTAEETGKLIVSQGANANVNVTLSCDTKTASFKDGRLDENGSFAAMLEVEAGDVVSIWVSAENGGAVDATFAAQLKLPNSATNPIDITAFPYETQIIESTTPVYYRVSGAKGMLLVIHDADAVVTCGDAVYTAQDGVVTVPLDEEIVVVSIGNAGEQGKKFLCTTEYPLGSAQNPEILTDIQSITAALVQKYEDGRFFSWTVPGSGLATFQIADVSVTGADVDLAVTVGDQTKRLSQDGVNGVLSVALTGGDQVTLQVVSNPAADVQATVTGQLDRDPNTAGNPQVITDITQIVDVQLDLGDTDGYFYVWTADDDCTATLELSNIPAGVQADMLLKCGDVTAQMANGKASLAVKQGEKLLIQVSAGAAEAQMKLAAAVTYDVGTAKNPEKLTDITVPATKALEAGDSNGYHYFWVNNIDNGTLTFTVTGGNIRVYVNGTLAEGNAVAVRKDDELIVQLIAADNNAATVQITGVFAYALGSLQNPITVESYPYTTAVIPAGETMYFKLKNIAKMELKLTNGSNGGVVYNGTTYYTGVLMTADGQLIGICNEGTEESAYSFDKGYPLGTKENPEVISDIAEFSIEKTLDGQHREYYYKLAVQGPGSLELTRQNTSTGFTYSFIVNGTAQDVKESGNQKKLAVTAGEVIIVLQLNEGRETPANVNITQGKLIYTEGTILNPKPLKASTNRVLLNNNTVVTDSNGYYLAWTNTKEGTVRIHKSSGTSVIVLWVNGVEQCRITATGDTDWLVEEGDDVLLQALPVPNSELKVNFNGYAYFIEPEGSRTNAKPLTSQSTISATTILQAGDNNGYHYSFACPDNIAEGTLFLNADAGDKAVIKLISAEDKETVLATSSNGHVYMKIKAKQKVLIQVMAVADSNGYPALTTNLSGGISEPPGEVAAGKIRYTVSVTETNNVSVTGLKVSFASESGVVIALVDVVNGEAIADLAPGTYTVTPRDANGAYYLNSKSAMVTVDVKDAELRVTKIASVDEGSTLKDAYYMQDEETGVSKWYAYRVKIGVTEAMVDTSQRNYSADDNGNCFFLFEVPAPGTYEFTTDDDDKDATVSLWNISAAGFRDITPNNYDAAANTFVIEVKETEFNGDNKPMFMIGIKCGPTVDKTRLIITDLNKVPQDISLMPDDWTWYSDYEPEVFSLHLSAGQTIQPVSETDKYTVVYNESDGYYHFGTANGPIVYVNLDFSNLSFKKMINPGGNTGTAFRKYWFEDGLCTKKEEYTDVMSQYILSACEITQGETTYLLYPMTKDLQYMMEVGGQRWWDIFYNDGAEYIYKDEEGNNRTDVTLNPGWLFACCQIKDN